jgi:hypothetical protein
MTIKLVTPPTAEDDVKASIIKLLETTLTEAKAGELRSIIIIAAHINNGWIDRASETLIFSEVIGRLEIMKQRWIKQYLDNNSM